MAAGGEMEGECTTSPNDDTSCEVGEIIGGKMWPPANQCEPVAEYFPNDVRSCKRTARQTGTDQ